MADYKYKPAFSRLVAQANPNYTSKKCSMASLLKALEKPVEEPEEVIDAVRDLAKQKDKTYVTKANKYKRALLFLQNTYPKFQEKGQWVSIVPAGSKVTQAVKYDKKDMPNAFNEYIEMQPLTEELEKQKTIEILQKQASMLNGQIALEYQENNIDRLVTQSTWLNMTVEEFLYTSNERIGIVLIHMGKFQPPMYDLKDGWTVLSHMQSVLRAASLKGNDICVLHLDKNPVCRDLAEDVESFGKKDQEGRIEIRETGNAHMGGRQKEFREFIARHNTIVVMGFDANVCVKANLFGTKEYYDDTQNAHATVPPILSQANVVTSRALLVGNGVINHCEAYGELSGI